MEELVPDNERDVLIESLVANDKTGCCGEWRAAFKYGMQTALEASGWHHTKIKALFDEAHAEANRQYEEEEQERTKLT